MGLRSSGAGGYCHGLSDRGFDFLVLRKDVGLYSYHVDVLLSLHRKLVTLVLTSLAILLGDLSDVVYFAASVASECTYVLYIATDGLGSLLAALLIRLESQCSCRTAVTRQDGASVYDLGDLCSVIRKEEVRKQGDSGAYFKDQSVDGVAGAHEHAVMGCQGVLSRDQQNLAHAGAKGLLLGRDTTLVRLDYYVFGGYVRIRFLSPCIGGLVGGCSRDLSRASRAGIPALPPMDGHSGTSTSGGSGAAVNARLSVRVTGTIRSVALDYLSETIL